MSEYWKSTPNYWCKFCSQYVRDTTLERKNHEASLRHQNNIQRSLRELHKTKEREEREKQRAKDEVRRLNGLVGGEGRGSGAGGQAAAVGGTGGKPLMSAAVPSVPASAAARRAQAEQLAALGVALPEELKREVMGVGSFQVVNAREAEGAESVTVNRSLAEILAEARREEERSVEGVKEEVEEDDGEAPKGALKRKVDEDDDLRDEEAAPKRKAWGSNIKSYPGARSGLDDIGDLDALLSGVQKKEPKVEAVKSEPQWDETDEVKKEDGAEATALSAVPDIGAEADAAPVVVFKKRKGKK